MNYNYFLIALLCFFANTIQAQLTNYQNTVTKCYSGPTQSFNNTTGTAVGSLNFIPGVDIPLGHKIVDVVVEVVWSKTDDGSCTPITGTAVDLSHVGFVINAPGTSTRYLAASSATGSFSSPSTSSTFTGSANVISDTVVFKYNYPSPLPASLPIPGRDTISPNNVNLSSYYGLNPYGAWSIGGIDDAPTAGPSLCIHSYCITLVTCDNNTINALCKANPTVSLDPTGLHSFEFIDLDSLSDVSCRVKNITFSPANANCSDVGSIVPVTMTIQDELDSVSVCTSNVTIIDDTPPVITSCIPGFSGIVTYLDATGQDTFWASEAPITDNCGTVFKHVRGISSSVWTDKMTFDCITNYRQFWVKGTDASGNVDSCRMIIQVLDTFPPIPICGNHTAYLTTAPNGAVTVDAIDVDGGSYDVCPPIVGRWIGSQFSPPPIYTCADLGLDTVQLVVADASGNLASCSNAIITILDTISPIAVCKNDTVYLDIFGNGSIGTSSVENGSIDHCGIDSLNINGSNIVNFNCSHVNSPQAITLSVFDSSGNVGSCIAMVTVLDTFPPTANCRNFSAYLNQTGSVSIIADSLNNNSIDLCTMTHLTYEIAGKKDTTFSCADIGAPIPLVLTVIDSFGNANNSSTCTSFVTLYDTVAPTANCISPTIYLNNSGIANIYAADLSSGSSDNCSIVDSFVNTIGTSFLTLDCNSIFSPTNVTLLVRDATGNIDSCSTLVNVIDTLSPLALCHGTRIVQLDIAGSRTISPSLLDSNSNDNCGIVEYLINGNNSHTYSCSDLGTQTAVLTVRDSSNNIDSCLTVIQVEDNIPPTVSCRANTASLNSSGIATVYPDSFIFAGSTNDNCGTTSYSFLSGNTMTYTCDSLGVRNITILVSDNFGNQTSCTTTITVSDIIAPTAICRATPFTVQLDSSNSAFIVPSNINNGSFDLCSLDSMSVNGFDSLFFDCNNLGPNTVSLLVLDSSGNQSSCQATVVVEDVIPPTALCHDTTIYLNASGTANLLPSDIDLGSSDECSAVNLSINGLTIINYQCSQVASNPVQLTVTDIYGNNAYCIANVTVTDTFAPIANCIPAGSLNVYLDSSCFASIPANALNSGSLDNCPNSLNYSVAGLPTATFNASYLTTNPNPITLTVRDLVGNTSTCTTTIIVHDTIAPVIYCQPDTLQITGTSVTLYPFMINNGSTDNCSVPSLSVNGQSFISYDCSHLGLNTVTLIGTDLYGNKDSCMTTVFIEDVVAPNASCQLGVSIALDTSSNLAILAPSLVNNNSIDNCAISTFSLSQDTFDCSFVNNSPHTITLTVTDSSGNASSCTTQLTVEDTISPTALCINTDTLYFTGIPIVINANDIDLGSNDNCAIQNISINQNTFGCADIGVNSVILSVSDSSGNIGTCMSTIFLLDSTANAAAGADQLLCSTDSTTLNATSVNGFTGTWTSNTSSTIINPNAATTVVQNIPTGTNVFYWTLSNATCSSLSIDSMVITVIPTSNDTSYAGNDQSVCNASTILLASTPPLTSTGLWVQDSAQSVLGSLISSPTDPNTTVTGILPGNSYTFVWQLTNGLCGVHSTDTVSIHIDAIPNDMAMAGNDVLCSPDSINLAATNSLLGTGIWTTPSTALIANDTNPTTLVSNFIQDTTMMIWSLSNGTCVDYSSDTMFVILDAEWPVLVNDSFHIIANGLNSTIDVIANDNLPATWNISLINPIIEGSCINLNDGTFDVDINEARLTQYFTYQVCNLICPAICDSAEVTLSLERDGDCYTPNAFTPNGDGSNDFFIIPCLASITGKASLSVFNRWGNLVYETDNYQSDWDGTHKNQPLPNGTYFYILQMDERTPQKGAIEIRR